MGDQIHCFEVPDMYNRCRGTLPQAAETGLLLHLSTVWSLAVIQQASVCMRTEATYIALKRPRPCSICEFRVSAARTIHYGLPLYLRVRKSHTHEHMAVESELTPTAKNVGGILI